MHHALRRGQEEIADYIFQYPARKARVTPDALTRFHDRVTFDLERFSTDSPQRRVDARINARYGRALHTLLDRAFIGKKDIPPEYLDEASKVRFSHLAALHRELDDTLERPTVAFPVSFCKLPLYFSQHGQLILHVEACNAEEMRAARDTYLSRGGLQRIGRQPIYEMRPGR